MCVIQSDCTASQNVSAGSQGTFVQILDISRYLKVEPEMTKEMIDQAAEAYFVEL